MRQLKLFIPLVTLALLIQATPAQAWGWGRPHPRFYPHGRCFDVLPLAAATLIIAGATYYYEEGVYYQRRGNQYIVIPAPVGAVVTTIPAGYQPVIIDGVPYYAINGVTYMSTPYGYQVVPTPQPIVVQTAPVVVAAPAQPVPATQGVTITAPAASEDAYTVNIPNSKNGYTPIVLKRSGNGFIGPQGEYYPEFPRIEQLKIMYAK